MSLENVKAYYERLANDESFLAQVKGANSKDECSQIVQAAGYNFTQEEFEDYTNKLLESIPDGELQDLNEQELEAVFGGVTFRALPQIIPVMHYGLPPNKLSQLPWENRIVRPMYGLPIRYITGE